MYSLGLTLILFWQPIYLIGMFLYHTFKGDNPNSQTYLTAFFGWWGRLVSLIFSKPEV